MVLELQYFGGRGASSSGGGGGASANGEFKLPDGSKIEFDGTLQFGVKDANLTGKARQNVENFENRRVTGKLEYAYAVDGDGNPVGNEIKGGKGSVRTPLSYHNQENGTFTHIHPREEGVMGGTFSRGDLVNFANGTTRTSRAAAKEGTYSISKTDNFDSVGFKAFIAKTDREFDANYKARSKGVTKDMMSGKISYDDYLRGNAKAFNTALVDLHNAYLQGQKQYGYTYTLEQRG